MKQNILQSAFLCLLVLSFASSMAQTGTIKGIITTTDNQPVPNGVIVISNITKHTGNDGSFVIKEMQPGTYSLSAFYPGHDTVKQQVLVEADKVAAIFIPLHISAQQLKEVVVSTTKNKYKADKASNSLRLNEPLKDVPQNIQIVSGAALADQQVISMSDGAIRNVSGATKLEHWGDLYARINMRGSQIAAFRNGVNVVNSSWGPLTEDMSFTDHIEFVKGPAGFMMANGDPSGMYNVVTKKPTGNTTNGEASITMGSYDLYRATVDVDGRLDKTGKLSYRLNLMDQTRNSFRPYEYNNRYSIAPVLSYKLNDQTTLTFEYTLQHVKMSNVGSYYAYSTKGYAQLPVDFTVAQPGLDPTVINDHSSFLNLQHKINDQWKITAQAVYLKYDQRGSSMWPTKVNDDGTMIRNVSIWDAASEIKSGQAYVNGDMNTGSIHHRILGGLDMSTKNYLADWSQSHDLDSVGAEFNTYQPVYGTPVNDYPVFDRTRSLEERANAAYGTINQRSTGLYLQDELGFMDNKFRLTLAGRYTYVSQSAYGGKPDIGKQFTPRLGLSYSLNTQTSFYALFDEAFIPQTGMMRNGAKVKPITGDNIEAGVKKDWMNGKWNTTLSVYRIMKNNELTADPNNSAAEGFSIVLGEKVTQGVEFDMKGELAKGLNLIVNYAYTDSRVTSVATSITEMKAGDRIPGYAMHNINAWLSYKIQKGALSGAGVSAGFNYQADRDTWSWGTAGTKNLPDYFRLDGGLFWEKGNLKLTANVFNLLNTYLYSGSYYAYGGFYYWQAEAPRNSRLSITYKF